MATSKRTWISIVIASVIVIILLALAAVGGTAFFIYRHIDAQTTSETSAAEQFATTRARFSGEQPLILIQRDEPVVRGEALKNAKMPDKPLESLNVLAYDENDSRLVRVSIPFWLLRLFPSKNLSFLNDEGIDIDTRRIRLTLEDIEKRGPGLILDQKDRRGSQVLIWTE
jgi:flagellar basal body-associated protein FliL